MKVLKQTTKGLYYFWPLGDCHETEALVVLSGMHFKLKSVPLCTISLECGVHRLCPRVPVMIPVTSTTYETQSQSG